MDRLLARQRRPEASRLAASMYPFWDLRGYYSEGREWYRRVLPREGFEGAGDAKTFVAAAGLAYKQDDLETANELYRRGLEMGRLMTICRGLHRRCHNAVGLMGEKPVDERTASVSISPSPVVCRPMNPHRASART